MEAQQKACITQAPVLKYFDVNEDVILSVDACSEGPRVPVCCKGTKHAVAYTSSSLINSVG